MRIVYHILMDDFKALVRKKGTGPTMSKSLWKDDFPLLESGFKSDAVPLSMKATLLTSLLTLDPNPDEASWIQKIRLDPYHFLPEELIAFITQKSSPHPLFEFCMKAISHQDLNREDTLSAVNYLLDSSTPDFLKASFLEAERLKRESFEENKAFLDSFKEKSAHYTSDLPCILDIAHAYDGFNRHYFLAPFIAATLGALGYPTVLHGTDSVAPKFGVNTHKILNALNLPIPDSLETAHAQLKTKGWTYIDQSQFFPELYALKQLREDMVKRPVLATVEKFLHPIQSSSGNILITGYTHPAYKDMTARLLLDANTTKRFIFFRGTEGSAQLGLDRRAPYVCGEDGKLEEGFISPVDFQLSLLPKLEPNYALTAKDAAREGLAALNGEPGLVRDTIIYNVQALLSLISSKLLVSESELNTAMATAFNSFTSSIEKDTIHA